MMRELLLLLAALVYSSRGYPVEHNYQEDIAHLQDEVNFLKANLTAVWEKLHEHDELHRTHVEPTHHERRPLRSVVRETRRFRVTLNFFMDIPEHPGEDGAVVVQEVDRNNPVRSVLRQTRDFNVSMHFFLDVPEHPHEEPTPTPVRTAVRQNSRWRVNFSLFLDIPEHPGQPGAVTTQVVDPSQPVRSVVRDTRQFRVHMNFFVDAPEHHAPVRSVSREVRNHTVNMDFFVNIPQTPGGPHAPFHPNFDGTQAVSTVTRETRRHSVHFDFFLDIPEHPRQPDMHYAHCEMEPNTHLASTLHHQVHGSIRLSQQGNGPVRMETCLSGFNTSEDFANHRHGLQIHEYGDLSEGCGSLGELYHNEHAADHVNPGDLGDVIDDDTGSVHFSREFDWLQINLADGILGRSLVILQGDHNQAGSEQIACCVIGRTRAH
uniref:Segon n=1 Tax=Crassostrea brasiliana TaxID=398256 RepID=A0A167Q6K2_9BIVA|nr:segon [Crassostrea brasiliana]